MSGKKSAGEQSPRHTRSQGLRRDAKKLARRRRRQQERRDPEGAPVKNRYAGWAD
jgi:hypothetical protein